MSTHRARLYVAASWMLLALLVFLAFGVWSIGSVVVLAVIGLLPPIIMLALWKEPSPTISEVIRATEERR